MRFRIHGGSLRRGYARDVDRHALVRAMSNLRRLRIPCIALEDESWQIAGDGQLMLRYEELTGAYRFLSMSVFD
jgi:hypothetical protein